MFPTTTPTKHPRILLLTHPRSASNLLVRILNLPAQSDFSSPPFGGYPFFNAYNTIMSSAKGIYLKPMASWTEDERKLVREKYEECVQKLNEIVVAAEKEGRGVFIKDHSGFCAEPVSMERISLRAIRAGLRIEGEEVGGRNPKTESDDQEEAAGEEESWTIASHQSPPPPQHSPLNTTPFPDTTLLTWTPTFLIRHPALAYPSYHRAFGNKGPMHKMAPGCTLQYTRRLYEFFANNSTNNSHRPILLASSDIINPLAGPALLKHYCALTGLDASRLTYTWSAATPADLEKMPEIAVIMTKSLQASQGILVEKGGDENVDVEVEIEKWKVEFGVEEAAVLERWCRDSLGDWEWLWERRLRVASTL